jgi:hypothetical protein
MWQCRLMAWPIAIIVRHSEGVQVHGPAGVALLWDIPAKRHVGYVVRGTLMVISTTTHGELWMVKDEENVTLTALRFPSPCAPCCAITNWGFVERKLWRPRSSHQVLIGAFRGIWRLRKVLTPLLVPTTTDISIDDGVDGAAQDSPVQGPCVLGGKLAAREARAIHASGAYATCTATVYMFAGLADRVWCSTLRVLFIWNSRYRRHANHSIMMSNMIRVFCMYVRCVLLDYFPQE